MNPSPRAVVELLRAVGLLGLPAAQQIDYLKRSSLGDCADELGLLFDDSYRLMSQFVDLGWVTDAEAAHLARLNELLSAISGPDNADLWTEGGLSGDSVWAEIRLVAQRFFSI